MLTSSKQQKGASLRPGQGYTGLLEEMKDLYIHYGHKEFDRNLFSPITNQKYFTKPHGGFWASRVDAEYGWKDWCEAEEFRTCEEDNAIRFVMTDTANIVHVHSCSDLANLPKVKHDGYIHATKFLDFEKMQASGIDAIELHLSDDAMLYWDLYGWDCDSILIMNPEIIEVVKGKQ